MTSQFDPNAFLQATFEESNSTESIPIPVGEYPALVDKVDIVAWASRDGTKNGLKLQLIWNIMDEEVRTVTGRAENKVRQDIMLDLTEGGMLDMGKGMNVRLGKLREATGLNVPGEAFGFPMFAGRMAKVSIKHRAGEQPGELFAEVGAVAKQ